MSDLHDPLEPLRSAGPEANPPSVEAIRARARSITSRRRSTFAAAAASVMAVAAVGIALQTGGDPVRPLADQRADSEPSMETYAEGPGLRVGRDEEPPAAGQSTRIVVEGDREAASQAVHADGSGLVARLDIEEAPRGAVFTFEICNESDQTVTREFSSGQRYDIEVTRDGETIWRWSDEMAFLQALGTERWAPGECSSYRERWDGTDRSGAPAPPGKYEGAAILVSTPPMQTPSVGFCLVPC